MSWNPFRKGSKSQAQARSYEDVPDRRGDYLPAQDTKAAIDDLSRVVRNNSEVVEIYLALGSLYRSQGEIERAIQIRNNLIVRPGLDPRFKARAYFELGRDFRRAGFLDRAHNAFAKAKELGGDPDNITLEEAKLAAQRGDFTASADLYGQLGRHLAQAHYLVRKAQECFAAQDESQGAKLLRHALKVYPASVEAWLEKLLQAVDHSKPSEFSKILAQGLEAVEPVLRFVLLEGLVEVLACQSGPACDLPEKAKPVLDPDLGQAVVEAVDSLSPDALLCYFAAKLLLLAGDDHMAESWFERTLLTEPEFWLARLELFGLSLNKEEISSYLAEQLDYFLHLAHQVKRFVCSRCGLRRDHLFFICPRCHSWHSIAFRAKISQ